MEYETYLAAQLNSYNIDIILRSIGTFALIAILIVTLGIYYDARH